MVYILNAKMHSSRTCRLGKAVVGIVIMMREKRLPTLDKSRRNRLSADMHKPPTRKIKLIKLHLATIYRIKKILRPRNEKPNYRTFLFAYGAQNPLGLDTLQKNGLAAHEEAPEPVHFRARMIKRWNAKERILLCLRMVLLLNC